MINLNSLLEFSAIALKLWPTLDATDRARIKLNFRAWVADARLEHVK